MMTALDTPVLAGLRLLVVEDEFMIAEHIAMLLEDFGCDVAGPVGTIEQALSEVTGGALDGALLDANLNGESSAPIAMALEAASVPFIVATGYGSVELPDEILNRAERIIKPISKVELESVLTGLFRVQAHSEPEGDGSGERQT